MKNGVVRTPSPLDEFIFYEGVTQDGTSITFVQNDLFMLFNQERLSKIGFDTVASWLEQLQSSKDSGLDKLRNSLNDDELLSLVKSRHIQAPSELLAYSKWLNDNADEYTKAVQEIQKESVPDVDNVEETSKVE